MRRWRTAHAAGLLVSFILAIVTPGVAVAAPAIGTVSAAPVTVPVDPADCAEIAPGPFGAAPAGGLAGGTCRRLSVPAPGSYLVDPWGEQNIALTGAVYGPTGTLLCESIWCTFPAAGSYTLVVEPSRTGGDGRFAVAFHSATAGGCGEIGERGLVEDPYQGSHTAIAEVDCLQLPSTAGAFRVFRPAAPVGGFATEVQLIRPSGRVACGATLFTAGGCPVTGSAPLRLLVFPGEKRPVGDYTLAVQRMDAFIGCPVVGRSFPDGAAGATLSLSGVRSAACLSIPAARHAAREFVTLDRITGTGTAGLEVYGAGRRICTARPGAAGAVSCRLADGANTVVVQAAGADSASYRIGRVDAAPASGCRTPADMAMGGRATEGTLSEPGEVHCYRVGGPAVIGLRTTGPAAQALVIDAAGNVSRCLAGPCGSRGDHVFVAADPAGGRASYQLDTWTLAGCPTASLARNRRGEISGALTAADRADCLGLSVGDQEDLRVTLAGAPGRPVPYLVNPTGTVRQCPADRDVYLCRTDVAASSPTGLVHLLLSTPGQPDPLSYQARVECVKDPCGGVTYWVDGVANAIGVTGTGTVTLQGGGFHLRDTVTLTRPGHGSIPARVRTVSADGSTLTAEVNVAGVAVGPWDLSLESYRTSDLLTATGVVSVSLAELTAGRAPSISGAVQVGSTVRAVPGQWAPAPAAYAYQWSAEQVAIRGATGATYTIPAALRGKRLTVTVTAKRPAYLNTTRQSASVMIGWGIAPKATKAPKITGTVRAGRTVQASVGAWSPTASAYRYEWRLNGKVIRGAAAAKLKINKSWAGKKLTVVVIAKRAGHTDGRAVGATVKIKR